jgi:hypothetical protein
MRPLFTRKRHGSPSNRRYHENDHNEEAHTKKRNKRTGARASQLLYPPFWFDIEDDHMQVQLQELKLVHVVAVKPTAAAGILQDPSNSLGSASDKKRREAPESWHALL